MIRLPRAVLVLAALLVVPLAWALVAMMLGGASYRPGTLAMYAVLALLSALAWSLRWWVDDAGVERRMPYLPRLRLAWGDVESVSASGTECVLRGPGKVRVRIVAGWAGYGFFAGKVLKHVPGERYLDDAVRRELEARAWAYSEVWDHYPTFSAAAVPPAQDPVRRWRENPFFVLGLPPECTAADVERTGQKLLGLLALEVASAGTYPSPFGPASRTADDVRGAMAELRDPDRRMVHEVWARVTTPDEASSGDDVRRSSKESGRKPDAADESRASPWKESMAALGWRRL
jgi:hypothetical protein